MMAIEIIPVSFADRIITPTNRINAANGAHITAIGMTIIPNDCDEHCNSTITVTWKNMGNGPGKFRPGIRINDDRIRYELITLAKNQTTTQIFNLTDLMEGIYTICPDPN